MVRGSDIWGLWVWDGHEGDGIVLLLAAEARTCDVLENLKGVGG